MKTQAKSKKNQNNFANQNPLEVLKGIGGGIRDSFVDDLAKESMNWDTLLGLKGTEEQKLPDSGELAEGQELNLKKNQKKEHGAAPAIDYHREIAGTETRITRENHQVIKSKIEEILIELKKLSQTSSEIAMEFKQVTVEQRIEKPGEYHVTFFQWMLSMVRAARVRIEDSGAWLNVMKSKKSQKNYWAMFKKHGTTFGLSNERVVASQTG